MRSYNLFRRWSCVHVDVRSPKVSVDVIGVAMNWRRIGMRRCDRVSVTGLGGVYVPGSQVRVKRRFNLCHAKLLLSPGFSISRGSSGGCAAVCSSQSKPLRALFVERQLYWGLMSV